MYEKEVIGIFIAPESGKPMEPMNEVHAVPGKGIEGDRYYKGIGYYSKKPGPDRQLTLIENETLEALKREIGVELSLGDSRRNIVTKNVPLNHLVGKKFKVGEVVLRGVRLSTPCDYLTQFNDKKVLPALVHRAGLNAEILTEGKIKVGDTLEFLE